MKNAVEEKPSSGVSAPMYSHSGYACLKNSCLIYLISHGKCHCYYLCISSYSKFIHICHQFAHRPQLEAPSGSYYICYIALYVITAWLKTILKVKLNGSNGQTIELTLSTIAMHKQQIAGDAGNCS